MKSVNFIAEIKKKNLLKNHWTESTKIDTKHPLVKETQGFTNKKPFISQIGDHFFFFPYQCYDTIIALLKCVY